MLEIDAEQIEELIKYPDLIDELKKVFNKNPNIPARHHHQYPNPKEGIDSTLLLMPAWNNGDNLGVKIINVCPNNGKYDLPTIQGTYLLFDQHFGTLKAFFDAKKITVKRTAAASALASQFLSRVDSESLLMIGTGALAPELIKAHVSVRPINKVYVWGRDYKKALAVCAGLHDRPFTIEAIKEISQKITEVDIVSCATLSDEPILFGKDIVPGQHIDLVGSYKPDMREANDELIKKVSLFVDTKEGATKETGDIVIPLKSGVIKLDCIKADLFEMCGGKVFWRNSKEEITCFKSVGHALEDLVAAKLVYDKLTNRNS